MAGSGDVVPAVPEELALLDIVVNAAEEDRGASAGPIRVQAERPRDIADRHASDRPAAECVAFRAIRLLVPHLPEHCGHCGRCVGPW